MKTAGRILAGVGFTLAAVAVLSIKQRWVGLSLAGRRWCSAAAFPISSIVSRGSVVDFMSVGVDPLRTGIFNVADVAVMIGIALIAPRRRGITE